MRQIDKAIAACNAQEDPCCQAIANEFGVKRTTLSRRHRGVQTSCENVTATHHNLLSKPQQNELVNYINKLSNKGLPPTIPVVRMLAIDICKIKPGTAWSIKRPVRRLTVAGLIAKILAAQSSQSMKLSVLIQTGSD